jgi:DNA modification methylase
MVFIKGGANAEPVAHPKGLNTYAGETEMPEHLVKKYSNYEGDQKKNLLSHWIWRRYASPVWMDIRQTKTLNAKSAREADDEKHLCPLQLDVIERALVLWSNPCEVVFTPFMGVGSEVYGAVLNGRKGIGSELKTSYYNQAVRNLAEVENHKEQDALL